jgi:hypothetical protein
MHKIRMVKYKFIDIGFAAFCGIKHNNLLQTYRIQICLLFLYVKFDQNQRGESCPKTFLPKSSSIKLISILSKIS